MNIQLVIREIQSKLPGLVVDGKAGPATWQAIRDFILGKSEHSKIDPVYVGDLVDARSEKNIATLLPEVRPYARSLVRAAADIGIVIKVTSGTRTYEEQNALFNQPRDGKDNDGDGRVDEKDETVTYARAGHSNHNFGLAFDVTIFDGTEPVWESPSYKAVGALGKNIGLEWGGNFKSINDEPHFQLRPKWAAGMSEGEMLTELRERKQAGKPLLA